jgi:hypothetical protein
LQNRYNLMHEKGTKHLPPKEPLENPIPAFALSNLLLMAIDQRSWSMAEDCCNDFMSWIAKGKREDIRRFVRLILPVVVYEKEETKTAALLAAEKLYTYVRNHYDEKTETGEQKTDSYELEKIISEHIKAACPLPPKEREACFKRLAIELRRLIAAGDLATISFSKFFPFLHWAEYHAKERNSW